MSEASVASSPAAPEAGGGFFQNLIDLYFAPREAFARIVRATPILLPLVAYVALVLGFTGIWLHKVDPIEFMKTQIEESPRADKMTAEQKQAVIQTQAKMMPIFGWVFGPVFIAILILIVSGGLMFVFRFFYGGDVGFKQAVAIVVWTFLAVGIVHTPVMLTVMSLKGDWNLDPNQVVQANLGLLLDKSTAAKPLWALFTSIDAFVLWTVFLLAVGFGVATKKPTSSTLWGVVVPWLVIVAIKVGWSALF
jgi:Yip1-like protein